MIVHDSDEAVAGMHIGLIGGIGPAATDFYYRHLIEAAAKAERALDLTVVHADAPTLLANLATNADDAQIAIYKRLAERLQHAGAECMAVTSIAGHFCIDAFVPLSPLPVIDLTAALRSTLEASGVRRVGVLGTKTVMATKMYGKLGAVDVVAPPGEMLDQVHEAYVRLATTGRPTDDLRDVFFAAGAQLVGDLKAEAVLLGGTDLNVAFDGQNAGFPIVDCAAIHIEAIAQHL